MAEHKGQSGNILEACRLPLDETSFLSKSGHRVNAASTQSRNQSGYACGKRKY